MSAPIVDAARPYAGAVRGPAPRAKTVHRASLIGRNGEVSALCFKRPRNIDLRRATWTNRDEAVTCPKCKTELQLREARG